MFHLRKNIKKKSARGLARIILTKIHFERTLLQKTCFLRQSRAFATKHSKNGKFIRFPRILYFRKLGSAEIIIKFDPDILPKSFIQKRVRLNSKMHFVVRGRRMGSSFGNRIQNGDREFFLRPSTAQMDESVAQNHSKSTVSFGFLRSRVPTLAQKKPFGWYFGAPSQAFRAPRRSGAARPSKQRNCCQKKHGLSPRSHIRASTKKTKFSKIAPRSRDHAEIKQKMEKPMVKSQQIHGLVTLSHFRLMFDT